MIAKSKNVRARRKIMRTSLSLLVIVTLIKKNRVESNDTKIISRKALTHSSTQKVLTKHSTGNVTVLHKILLS